MRGLGKIGIDKRPFGEVCEGKGYENGY